MDKRFIRGTYSEDISRGGDVVRNGGWFAGWYDPSASSEDSIVFNGAIFDGDSVRGGVMWTRSEFVAKVDAPSIANSNRLDLESLGAECAELADARAVRGDLRNPTPTETLKHCAGEVVEAMQAYTDFAQIPAIETRRAMVDEIGDVFACLLTFCHKTDISPSDAILSAIKKNRERED